MLYFIYQYVNYIFVTEILYLVVFVCIVLPYYLFLPGTRWNVDKLVVGFRITMATTDTEPNDQTGSVSSDPTESLSSALESIFIDGSLLSARK